MSYAHGGRKVELKGAEKLLRRQEEERRQAAEREKERAFQAAVERYSRPRRAVHDFIKTQPYWGHFFMGVILAYALMLGFKDPLVAEGAPGWDRPGFGIDNALIEGAEPYFTVLFTVDMVGGLTTYGFRRFFKDSWNLMDTVVVGSGWLDLAGLETGVGMLRMIRVFRPLRTLTKVESMRLIVSALVASVPGLASVLMLAGFMVFIFALFGLKMWIGVLSGRCFEPSAVAAGEQASLSWVGTHRHCCAQEQCGNDTCAATAETCVLYGNPEHGSQSFDNIGSAVLAVFTAMTAEGWSEIMDRLLDSQNATIVGVFFMMLMVMGGLFVTNYLLAECCVVFGQHMDNLKLMNADEEVMEEKRQELAMRDAARVISFMTPGGDTPREGPVGGSAGGGTRGRSESAKEAAGEARGVEPVPEEGQEGQGGQGGAEPEPEAEAEAEQVVVEQRPGCFRRARLSAEHFITSHSVDSFLTACISVNFVLLALDHYGQPAWWAQALLICNYILTAIFTVEGAIKIFGFGPLGYFRDPMNWLDFVCVATSLAEVFFQSGGGVSALRVLRLMRILRSMKMIKDGSALKQMIETAIASLKAVMNFGVLLLLLLYIFALLGMNLFGGKLFDDDGEVPRANYDTFIAAFISVFQVSTRENWHQMLYSAMRNVSPGVAVAYYVTLLILTNYILLALFMGTLLQNFQKHFADVKGADVGLPSIMPLVNVAKGKFLALRSGKAPTVADAVPEAEKKEDKSLFVFTRSHCLRAGCIRAMQHKWFERSVLFAIGASSCLLAYEHPNDLPGTTKATVLYVLDVVFTVFFVWEMSTKIIACGFIRGEGAYAKSNWNRLDGTVVVISVLTLLPGDGDSMKFLRVLRTVRALRPLQAVNKWPGLRTVVQSLANSIPSIMIVNTLALFFIMVFGILFVQLFAGALHSCSDDAAHAKLECIGAFTSPDGSMAARVWLNQRRNFDNIAEALLVMFELLTLEEWDTIMHAVVDATDQFHGPTRDNTPGFSFLFLIYIITGAFFILNLFVGVIVSAYNEAKAEAEQGTGMTETQEKRRSDGITATYTAAIDSHLKLNSEHSKNWQLPFLKIVMHSKFEWAVLFAIMANVGFMCLESVGQSDTIATVSEVANEVFAWVFLGEMVLKLLALGPRKYWSTNWNRFDGTIVTVSMVELVWKRASGGELPLDPTVIRLFRIFRVARFVRMAEKAKGIKNLIQTFLETLPYLVNVAALLSIFIFIYAVVGVALFTNVKKQETITEKMNFGNFGSSIVLLLRISTGEGWSGAMRDCQISEPECGLDSETGLSDCGSVWAAPLYYVTFMLLCTYVSLNVIVAVILFTFFDLEGNPDDKPLEAKNVKLLLAAAAKMREAADAGASGDAELAAEDEDGLPMVRSEQLNALLLQVKEPLGCTTGFHMDEMAPKLHRWMRREVKGWHIDSGQVSAKELLRFLIVYHFDVDVKGPEKKKRKGLWGKVSVVQQQPPPDEPADESVADDRLVPNADGGVSEAAADAASAGKGEGKEGSGGDKSEEGNAKILAETATPAMRMGGDDGSPVGAEGSLEWMERAVADNADAEPADPDGDRELDLSELERELEGGGSQP